MLSKRNRRNKNLHRVKNKFKKRLYRGGGNTDEMHKLLSTERSEIATEELINEYNIPTSVEDDIYNVIPYKGLTLDEAIALIWTKELTDTDVNYQIYRDVVQSGKYKILLDGELLNLKKYNEELVNSELNKILSDKFLPGSDDELLQLKILLTQCAVLTAVEIAIAIITGEDKKKLESEGVFLAPGKGVKVEEHVDGELKRIEKPISVNIISNKTPGKKANISVEAHYNVSNIMNPGPNDEFETYCSVSIILFYNGEKNKAFFLWKRNKCSQKESPGPELQQQEEELQQDPQQARTSINNIVLGSIGAAVVATGAVVGTLFGVGVLGGKSKKKRKTRKSRRKNKKIRKTRTKR
jgi:hypothetical protein